MVGQKTFGCFEITHKMILKQHIVLYPVFTKGLCSRWTHFQRTVPDISELFKPLETIIRNQLIAALIGQEVIDAERQFLVLFLRHGGLGLTNYQETAKTEYNYSTHRSLLN